MDGEKLFSRSFRAIANPQALRIHLWDDDDFDFLAYYSLSNDEREQIIYDNSTGEVLWQHLKRHREEATLVSEESRAKHDTVFEEYEGRLIARNKPLEE